MTADFFAHFDQTKNEKWNEPDINEYSFYDKTQQSDLDFFVTGQTMPLIYCYPPTNWSFALL